MNNLDDLLTEAIDLFNSINDADELEQAKGHYLGRGGRLTELLKGLGKLPPEDRPAMGVRINRAKEMLEEALKVRRKVIQERALEAQLAEETLDVTLPGRGLGTGGLHPVTRTLERIQALFHSIGFAVASGPEIETDFYNFTALNIPENHPARAMHDTFYMDNGANTHLLRTPHLAGANPLYAKHPAAAEGYCARPRLPPRLGFDSYPNVSSGGRFLGR